MASPAIAGTVVKTEVTTAATSLSINLPSGITAGETLVIFARLPVAGASTPTGFTDWSNLVDDTGDASGDRSLVYIKKATGSEGATLSITAASSSKLAAYAFRISGAADPTVSPPVVGSLGYNTLAGFSNPGNPAGLSAADYLFIAGGAKEGEDGTTASCNTAGGWALLLANPCASTGTGGAVATNARLLGAYKAVTNDTVPGNSPTFGIAPSGSSGSTTWMIAVFPAATGTQTNLTLSATQGQSASLRRMVGWTEAITQATSATKQLLVGAMRSASQAQAVTALRRIAKSLTTASSNYIPVILALSPALHWRFGESSGSTAEDLTTNNRDGTYGAGVTLGQAGLITGDADTAASFAGGTTAKVDSSYPAWTGQKTFLAWVTPSLLNSRTVFGSVTEAHLLRFESTTTMRLMLNSAVGSITWGATFATGTRYFIALTANFSTGAYELFVDKVSKGAYTGATTPSTSPNFSFGMGTGALSNGFSGVADEVTVVDGILTPTQIGDLFDAGSVSVGGVKAVPSLVKGLLKFLTLSATNAQTATLTRQTGKPLAATQSQTPTLRRAINAIRSVTQGQTPTTSKRTSKTWSTTQAQSATLTKGLLKLITLAATQAQSAIVSRLTSKNVTATQGQSSTVSRFIAWTRSVGQAQSTSATRQTRKTTSATQAQASTTPKLVSTTRSTTQGTSASVLKRVGKLLSAAQSSLADVVVQASGHVFFLTLSAASSTQAALSRAVSKLLSPTQAQSASTTKRTSKSVAATQAEQASTSRSVRVARTATQATQGLIARLTSKLTSTSQPTDASQSKRIAKSLNASNALSALLDRLKIIGEPLFNPTGWVHGIATALMRSKGKADASHSEPGGSASTGHASANPSQDGPGGTSSTRPHATGEADERD